MQVAWAILVTVVGIWVCAALIGIGVLGAINASLRWQLKAERITEYDIECLLGYAVKNDPRDVERLRWWMQFLGGRQREEVVVAVVSPAIPKPTNVVNFEEWRDRRVEVMEAAE